MLLGSHGAALARQARRAWLQVLLDEHSQSSSSNALALDPRLSIRKFSIVIPSLNQAQFLGAALRSIVNQRYPAVEIIVVDGGSEDETARVVESYKPHVDVYISESDRGQSHALNKGFAVATGDIMGWLNADDVYCPGAFWVARTTISVTSPTVVFGDYFEIVRTAR
ncbi:MAG TPA: glycosyltransferase [Acidimicrobiales bacterium]|nr:glycosyltransferase [Acidimicrobiales bacterium]